MKKSTASGKENDNEDDYSASVCAIMQQRNSTRRQSRRKRRPSSPFGVDNVDGVARRRSSVYTTSSGELVFATFKELEWIKSIICDVYFTLSWKLRVGIKLIV